MCTPTGQTFYFAEFRSTRSITPDSSPLSVIEIVKITTADQYPLGSSSSHGKKYEDHSILGYIIV
jgi:hypothetical protein